MGCGVFIAKYVLFFSNLFFALAGLTLLGLGIAVQLQVSAVLDVLDGNFQFAPITAMVVGGVVFGIAFFGCCGSVRESNCMLVTYSIFMILLMIIKIAFASLIFVNLGQFVDRIPTYLNTQFNQSNLEPFHQIEAAFQCCGTTGAGAYGINSIASLPSSCCAADTCTLLNSYPGCNTVLTEFFNTFGLAIGLVAITIVSIELVAVVFALCLANNARNMSRRRNY